MLTLENRDYAKKICDLVSKAGETRAVFFVHKRNKDNFRPTTEDVAGYKSKHTLSSANVDEIMRALQKQSPPESASLRGKYYKIRDDLVSKHYSELHAGEGHFEINIPPNRAFAFGYSVSGSTGSGKTVWVQKLIERNWRGKKSK